MVRTDRKQRLRLAPDSRRAAILDAAGKLFAARPYSEVTVAEIAEAAEGSGALVYRYFDGKEGQNRASSSNSPAGSSASS